MKTYALSTALKLCKLGRRLCLRPVSCVGTGNGVMFVLRNGYTEPRLPAHVPTLLGRWVVQTVASVEREELERDKVD